MYHLNYVGAVNTIRRDPELVFRCLRCFFAQKTPPQKVYLVDQNADPLQLPQDLLEKPIEHIRTRAASPSAARNQLPRELMCDWILFCDDDGYMAPDYSEVLQEALQEQPGLQLIGGTCIDDASQTHYSIRLKIGGSLDSLLGSKLLPGGNFLIRPSLFEKIGRFDERFGTGSRWASSEETDLCWKAIQARAPMAYLNRLVVFHPPAHDKDTVFAIKKSFRYGRGKGALAGKWCFERPSLLGAWEFLEMLAIPPLNAFRGVLRGELRQILIQAATFTGRLLGFIEFAAHRILPRTS